MTDLQHRIAALSPGQRAMLEERLAALAAARGEEPTGGIVPRDRTRPTPLAIQQQREWTLSQLQSAYNILGAFRVEGVLDRALLERVLTDVVDRHEGLRSTVELQADRTPVQVVHPVTPVPVPLEDLADLTDEEQRAHLLDRWRHEVETPFDPRHPLRLRGSLFRLDEEVHVVFITADHVAADAVSVSIMVEEFATLYVDGCPEPLPVQYGDFAAWQRAVEAERIEEEREHWRGVLSDLPPGLALPVDRPYPARPTHAGAAHVVELPADVTDRLRRFGEQEEASTGILLLAASAVLLHRYSGREDVVIGENVSGRNRSDLERLIGCFVGVLPMRVHVTDDLSLRDVVRSARDTVVTAYDHQDLPVDGLLDELDLGPESARATLIDMWLDIRTPETVLEVPGLRITPERIDVRLPAATPLTLDVDPHRDALWMQWIYMTEVLDERTVTVLADQFGRVLRALVEAPDTAVGEVRLAAAADPAPGGAAAATGDGPGFVELFRRRVAAAPYSPAAVQDGVATSYRDLDRAANRLAHRLRDLGVGRDVRVGILVDRSPRLATSILGVLKAGGAYLPIDADYPPERVADMLADADARVLVTLADLAPAVELPDGVTAVLLEDVADGPDDDLPDVPALDALAYVVYTSGSTGRPKGAMIEHGSLVTYARDVVDRLGLGAGDRFLQFASPGFDVLAEELFPTWIAGGAVVFPTRPLLSGEEDLADLVERERLTVVELPTAYWHEWVRELDRADRTLGGSLRLVIIGGEPVLPDRLARWRRLGVPLMNCYGLTETTVTSTFFRLDPHDPAADLQTLPIGSPLPSVDLRVLDRRLRPVPVGGTGELYLGGVGVGRGYLGRSALTAHRFVADPDPAHPGERLYRTGDLIRLRSDGELEFVARVDRQVKIRGFRVEPLEIESALGAHPGVAETVVDVHEPAPGDRRLVAYVVPGPDGMPAPAALRAHLEGGLPAHLVPSTFVELDAIPLTSNGKVDRDRLPAPEDARPAVSEEYLAPESELERTLAGIVSAVVGVEDVGVRDNFFEIGGDSILAIQVVARSGEVGIKLSPQDLFANPTVAGLAEIVGAGPAVDAEQADVTGPVPVSPGQRWFGAAALADPQHWNRSVVLEVPAATPDDVLEQAVERLTAHHDGLRQRILLAGAERMRVRIAPRGDAVPFVSHDLTGLDAAGQDRRLEDLAAEVQASLNPSVGPLVRVARFVLGGDRPDRVALVAHRLVADDASMGILAADLHAAVAALAGGQPATLPPKTTSWKSWVRRLVAYGGTPPVQSQRGYWTDVVAGGGGALPSDRETDPADDTADTERTVLVHLDPDETAALLALPDAVGGPLEAVLLAALGRTLTGWSGEDRHLVDVERPGRGAEFDEEVDLGRTVGWVSHRHPLALTAGTDEDPAATLDAVLSTLREVPGDGVGWSLLRVDAEPVPEAPSEVGFAVRDRSGAPGVPVLPGGFGADAGPRSRRPYPLEVEVTVADGALGVCWRYSERRHDDDTVGGLARRYLDELRSLVGAVASPVPAGPAATDFPLARVDQARIDDLLRRI